MGDIDCGLHHSDTLVHKMLFSWISDNLASQSICHHMWLMNLIISKVTLGATATRHLPDVYHNHRCRQINLDFKLFEI